MRTERKKLSYFELGSNKPTNLIFKNHNDLCDWIEALSNKRPIQSRVYLLTHNEILEGSEDFEVFVSEQLSLIYEIISNEEIAFYICNDFYLQEYESFEDAYSVALSMREGNPLCYNNTEEL